MKIKTELPETKSSNLKLPCLFQSIDCSKFTDDKYSLLILLVNHVDKIHGFIQGTVLCSNDQDIKVGDFFDYWDLHKFEPCNVGFKITFEQ